MKPGIRAVVVDDEPAARRRLARLLAGERDVEVVAQCGDVARAVRAVRTHRPDVVFLDIEIPGGGGFALVEALKEGDLPVVVFVTAYDQHAVRAFQVRALDYLLKPVSPERMSAAMARIRERLIGAGAVDVARLLSAIEELRSGGTPVRGGSGASAPPYRQRFLVPTRSTSQFVPVAAVDRIEAEGNYVSLHVGVRSYLVRGTLRQCEDELDPDHFARVHRSTIVNLDRVDSMRVLPSGDASLILAGGESVRVSRTYRRLLERRLKLGR